MRSVIAALARTTVLGLIGASLVLLVVWRLGVNAERRTIDQLQALNEEMEQRLEARAAMLERLNRTQRRAHLEIPRQRMDADGRIAETDILFVELDEDGTELSRQTFTVPGDVLFVDAWTVKFDQEQVAQGHPLFGRTLILLRRIYSDRMAPTDGLTIDTPGAVPPAYAVSEIGRFQQRLWAHFWQIATDADLAASMGVRVAQGEAVYKPVRSGQAFELIVDAVGGMNLVPLPAEAAVAQADG